MKEYSLQNLNGGKWVFILIKNNRILYRSKKQGLKPLIFCLKKYKTQMRGAVVFDKVVGRAAACLLVYGKVKKIMTPLASRGAIKLLKENKIEIEYLKTVPSILNKVGNDLCPMEKLSQNKTAKEFISFFKFKSN